MAAMGLWLPWLRHMTNHMTCMYAPVVSLEVHEAQCHDGPWGSHMGIGQLSLLPPSHHITSGHPLELTITR